MPRLIAFLVTLAIAVSACTGGTATSSPTPVKTGDIKRAKLDIAYSALADNQVNKPTSKALLDAALGAIKAEVRATGGTDEVATPEFQDVAEPLNDDFKKFAQAAGALAAKNPQLSADRIADAAINAMIKVKPDCHTYYRGATCLRRTSSGGFPPGDEAGLASSMLSGNIGYITWREFVKTGTYDITNEVRKRLDQLVAQGAKAWLLDLRSNIGGDPPQAMASWFLNGEPYMRIDLRTGSAGVQTAIKDLRLPQAYQLPIAVAIDGRTGSSPEVLTLALKENKRATIVGEKSVGALGATNIVQFSDGTFLAVTVQEFVGAQTGARYNNAGIPPDVPAEGSKAVDVAASLLREQLAQVKAGGP